MTDPFGVGSFFASMMTWLESRKLRKLAEANAKTLPAVAKPSYVSKPRRKSKPRKRTPSAAAVAAVELRRQKLAFERDKLQWTKTRDLANAAKWVIEQTNADEDDEYEDDDA